MSLKIPSADFQTQPLLSVQSPILTIGSPRGNGHLVALSLEEISTNRSEDTHCHILNEQIQQKAPILIHKLQGICRSESASELSVCRKRVFVDNLQNQDHVIQILTFLSLQGVQ
jgi:hypothetical protein